MKNTDHKILQNAPIIPTEVKLQNISVFYGKKVIYQHFSHTFDANKVHVILGKSGCGKTTLLNVIANLVEYQGEVQSGAISYVFQNPRLAKTTVFNNVEMVLINIIPDKTERANIVNKFLALAEIATNGASQVTQLSGGEQQRVSLARAFAYPSAVLLMDEPFKSLDLSIRKKLYKTLISLLSEQPRTTLLVTHDVDEALALADTIHILQDNPCTLTTVSQISTTQASRDLYSQDMLALRKQLEDLM